MADFPQSIRNASYAVSVTVNAVKAVRIFEEKKISPDRKEIETNNSSVHGLWYFTDILPLAFKHLSNSENDCITVIQKNI